MNKLFLLASGLTLLISGCQSQAKYFSFEDDWNVSCFDSFFINTIDEYISYQPNGSFSTVRVSNFTEDIQYSGTYKVKRTQLGIPEDTSYFEHYLISHKLNNSTSSAIPKKIDREVTINTLDGFFVDIESYNCNGKRM